MRTHLTIDSKMHVELGGLLQCVHIWSDDTTNPVLLFLHGGPGVPNRHTIRAKHLDLLDTFTLVAWDQRGTGGSYAGCPAETLTLDQLVEDAAELCAWLDAMLRCGKVNILGGSWGTELGTFLALRHPELVAAYVGYGQVVDGVANEDRSYAFALEAAQKSGDTRSIEALQQVGPPVEGIYHPVLQGLMTQRKIMSRYGGHSVKKERYIADTALPILSSPEYGPSETWGILKGYAFCLENMWPTIVRYDFLHDNPTPHFQMPYHIFQGVHDNNTPSSLVQDYFNVLEAPQKSLVWFEHSAHGPLGEEPERFKQLLREVLTA